MSEHPSVFYRYVNCNDSIGLEEYELVKKTPRGSWIKPKGLVIYTSKRPKWVKFVLDDSNKKFAWLTIEEARNSFLKRKKRQKELLESQLSIVEQILSDTSIGIWPEKPGEWTQSTFFKLDW